MIKKIFALTLFVSVCSILNINAQESESKHEVSFGVGCWANSQILDLMTDLTGTTMTAGGGWRYCRLFPWKEGYVLWQRAARENENKLLYIFACSEIQLATEKELGIVFQGGLGS